MNLAAILAASKPVIEFVVANWSAISAVALPILTLVVSHNPQSAIAALSAALAAHAGIKATSK